MADEAVAMFGDGRWRMACLARKRSSSLHTLVSVMTRQNLGRATSCGACEEEQGVPRCCPGFYIKCYLQ